MSASKDTAETPRRFGLLRSLGNCIWQLRAQYGWNPLSWARNAAWFVRDYRAYARAGGNDRFAVSAHYLFPCLTDKTATTPVEPVYFYQDAWAAGEIFRLRPARHYDIGSAAKTMAIVAQFVPVTMVDIRPVEVDMPGLTFRHGSILSLPFADRSIESLSSLCVVEHVGLGRYGDALDTQGSEKAIAELKRVLRAGGHLLISLPVDRECKVYFNAHRVFTRSYILMLLDGLSLVEEKYIYGRRLTRSYDAAQGAGTGLFHFVRP